MQWRHILKTPVATIFVEGILKVVHRYDRYDRHRYDFVKNVFFLYLTAGSKSIFLLALSLFNASLEVKKSRIRIIIYGQLFCV